MLTFFGNHVDHSVLVNISHAFHSPLADTCNSVRAANTTLSTSRSVEQCTLEVGIQFRIQFSIIAEHNPNRFISVNYTKFEICTEIVLQEVAMI